MEMIGEAFDKAVRSFRKEATPEEVKKVSEESDKKRDIREQEEIANLTQEIVDLCSKVGDGEIETKSDSDGFIKIHKYTSGSHEEPSKGIKITYGGIDIDAYGTKLMLRGEVGGLYDVVHINGINSEYLTNEGKKHIIQNVLRSLDFLKK